MKKYFLLFLLFLSIPVRADFFPEALSALQSEQHWISTYFKEDADVGIVHFRVWFKSPPDKVFKVLTDTNSFKHKLANYKDSRTLSKALFKKITDEKPADQAAVLKIIGENKISSYHNREQGANWTDYIFFDFNFPWPVKNRWAVQKVRVDETNSTKGEYKFEYKMESGNFKELFGYWKLLPVPGHPGWTEFRGRYESDAGITVPKFVMKKALIVGLKKDIEAYRKILGE